MRFLVHPELHTVVADNDLSYLESLLKDFLERAKLHPAALFKQLSSLEVGPLVTHEVGSNISNHPTLLNLCSRFAKL
jgi:predicted component of type VI protein secretion system